jgi:hypothetical protein
LDTPTLWPADQIERRDTAKLIPYARNARRHRPSQIAEIAASIKEWGWTAPILIDERDVIIAGHGRVLAAERLGIKDLPVCVARGWSEQKKRAYRLADNEIPLHAQWDKTLLRVELAELRDQGVDLELMGFAAEDALVGGPDPLGEVPQALQLHPPREYVVVMCADQAEWERLKVVLSLTPVRRGGYRKGSPLDDVGTQRVVRAADVLPRLETPPAYGYHPPRRRTPYPMTSGDCLAKSLTVTRAPSAITCGSPASGESLPLIWQPILKPSCRSSLPCALNSALIPKPRVRNCAAF